MISSRTLWAPTVAGTVLLASKGVTRLCSLQVQNGTAAILYLQLFNAQNAADVTIGSTVPDKVIKVEASVAPFFTFPNPPDFPLGLCYATTTTASGAVGAASAISFDLA